MRDFSVLNDAFDGMFTFEKLLEADKKARKRKKYRDEILEFTDDLDANLISIQERVMAGTFVFGPYRKHWVSVPKKRVVMALPYESRIVQWAIYQELNPFFDKMMIEDSYACRVGKGSFAAVERLQYWMREAEGKKQRWYMLQMDISKYFYRVDHAVLISILERRIKDTRLMNLLVSIINCNNEKFGLPLGMGPCDAEDEDWLETVGMPVGNLTSQMFANIYLNELDQYCKHTLRIHRYIRYMDDIRIMVETKEQAIFLREQIQHFLKVRLHLDLNKKTSVVPVGKVEFVGFIVSAHRVLVRKKTVERIKASWRAVCRKYFAGEFSPEEFQRRIASYQGIIKHCDADALRGRLNDIYITEKGQANGRYPDCRAAV